MRKTKEVLRLRFELGLGQRQIARSCGMGLATVHHYLERATAAGISWPLPEGFDEEELEAKLFGKPPVRAKAVPPRPQPDWKTIHEQLQQHRHLSLQLVWEEYRQAHPEGYRYSWFCERYQHWRRHLDVVLRQEHKAGEKMFVDWAGATIPIYDSTSGQAWPASLFVSVLGASSYTYAEACGDQQLEAWLQAHIHALDFYGGVPRLVVPDNTKTAVTRACRYDPDLNPTYQEFAMHYGMGVVPARPYKPRDKAKVESGVQVVERWIVAALRNRKFFSLPELNQAIRELLVRLNQRAFRKRDGSRASLFQSLEKPALALLPAEHFDMSQWSRSTVNIDYHIAFDGNFYSVPYALVQQVVEVRSTPTTIEIFHQGNRIASHLRHRGRGQTITQNEHRPRSHQAHLEWPPSRMVNWARSIGPHTAQLFERILNEKPHPEMGYRSCLGVIRLAQQYSAQRMEAAAERALLTGACRYQSVKSILKTSLDTVPPSLPEPSSPPLTHDNVRGADYFDRGGPTSC
jgi:transposase